MANQVTREQTGTEIVVRANGITHDQPNLLAAVELLDGFSSCRSDEERAANESCGSARHGSRQRRHDDGGCQCSSTMARTGVASTPTMASGKQINVTRSFAIWSRLLR